jgi:hypothetical protein
MFKYSPYPVEYNEGGQDKPCLTYNKFFKSVHKIAKRLLVFVVSVSLSAVLPAVGMEQLGSRPTDFH